MLALMKTLDMFGREKTVVTREQMRRQYSGFEYLITKAIAELPIDACFAAAFAAVLKWKTGLRCTMRVLCETFCLLTVTGASMGFAIGSLTSSVETALSAGVPIMVVLMVVGIINPSGVNADEPPPQLVQYLKTVSPIKWAIEALCVSEFRDMEFAKTKRGLWRRVLDLPRMGAFAMVQDGNQVLDALGLADATYEQIMRSLTILTCANLFISLVGLTFFRPTFVEARDTVMDTNSMFEDAESIKKTINQQKTSPDAPVKMPTLRSYFS